MNANQCVKVTCPVVLMPSNLLSIGANKFEKWTLTHADFFNLVLTVTVLENHNRSKALKVILKIFELYHQACR